MNHISIKQLGKDDSDIKLIPNTGEKYISFSKILKNVSGKIDNKARPITNKFELRLIDLIKFLTSS